MSQLEGLSQKLDEAKEVNYNEKQKMDDFEFRPGFENLETYCKSQHCDRSGLSQSQWKEVCEKRAAKYKNQNPLKCHGLGLSKFIAFNHLDQPGAQSKIGDAELCDRKCDTVRSKLIAVVYDKKEYLDGQLLKGLNICSGLYNKSTDNKSIEKSKEWIECDIDCYQKNTAELKRFEKALTEDLDSGKYKLII